MNLSTEKKIMDLENRLVAALGEREGVGGVGTVGLMDANYCSWNGFTMRTCYIALRTMSSYLYSNRTKGEGKIYTCNLVPMLYSGKKKKKYVWVYKRKGNSHISEENKLLKTVALPHELAFRQLCWRLLDPLSPWVSRPHRTGTEAWRLSGKLNTVVKHHSRMRENKILQFIITIVSIDRSIEEYSSLKKKMQGWKAISNDEGENGHLC